jgi:hypothetical protein
VTSWNASGYCSTSSNHWFCKYVAVQHSVCAVAVSRERFQLIESLGLELVSGELFTKQGVKMRVDKCSATKALGLEHK